MRLTLDEPKPVGVPLVSGGRVILPGESLGAVLQQLHREKVTGTIRLTMYLSQGSCAQFELVARKVHG